MMEPRNRYPREPSSYWVRGQYRSTEKVGCRGPAGVKEQGKGTEGASQEPVEVPVFPVENHGLTAPDRKQRSQAAGSVLVPDRAKTRAGAGAERRIHKSLGTGTGKS